MQCIAGLLVVVAAIVGIVSMRRGKRRGSGQLGAAMQNLEGLFVESKKHVVEAERRSDEEKDQSGDPPEKDPSPGLRPPSPR